MLSDTEIIDRAEKFYTRVNPICSQIHKEYSDDIEFGLMGKQWDKTTEGDRRQARRLTLTVNRLKQFIYKEVNQYKQQEMTSKVLPHDTSEKDKALAEVRRGIMRSLERKNGGLSCYNNAATTLITAGLGGWRIATDYVDQMSFDQEPKFTPILDMTTVLVDFEDCKEPDLSDMRECAVQEKYNDKARFKADTGLDADQYMGGGVVNGIWGTRNGPIITDFWFKEETKEKLCLLDPQAMQLIPGLQKTMYLSDLKKCAKDAGVPIEMLMANDPKTGKPHQRDTVKTTVRCAKIAAKQVLSTMDWPIDLIPVVIAMGRRIYANGHLMIEGLIRQSKDAQRSYNYLKSNKTERIGFAPKVPFMVPEGGIPKAQEKNWQRMHISNNPYLIYATVDGAGRPIPPPHRVEPVQVDAALVEEERASIDELKASMGIYDASLGNRSNETSGIAIRNRNEEADTINADFTESMKTAIKYSTKIINRLIPHTLDTERQVSMVGEDDKEKVVWINKETMDEHGQPYHYPMEEGEFDVDIEAGPGTATKGQDIRNNLQGLFQAVPGCVLPLGSTFIRNSEMRNSDEAADIFERWANTQSPGLYPDKKQGAPTPQQMSQMQAQLQQAQAHLQQMQPQMQQLTQENQQLKIENQAVKTDKSIEAQQLQIEQFNADTERMKVIGMLQAQQSNLLLAADKQDHTKTLDNAKVIDAAHQVRHNIAKDHVAFGADMHQQAHDQTMDVRGLQQADAQMQLNHAVKIAQAAQEPTGANPGESSTET